MLRRLAIHLSVIVLTLSFSSALSLAFPEPCQIERTADSDGACSPTCVTCGCCSQATEPLILTDDGSPDLPVVTPETVALEPIDNPARDILHVPKPL